MMKFINKSHHRNGFCTEPHQICLYEELTIFLCQYLCGNFIIDLTLPHAILLSVWVKLAPLSFKLSILLEKRVTFLARF